MATDVWALSAIASPATTDRVPIATGSNTGGYSLRAEFVWKGGGVFKADAPVQITAASGNAVLNLIETGVRNWALRSGALTTNVFDIADLTGGASRFSINQSGHVGIGGVNASTRLHVKYAGEIGLFETTTARGSGNAYIGIYDPTGRKGYFGYGGANDNLEIVNSMNAAVLFYTNNTERARIDAGGNLGIGVTSMTCKFHVKSSGEIARFETTTARGGGLCMHRFYDPTGEKAYTAFAGVDDTYYLMNRMNAGIIFGTNDINRWQIANNGNFYPQTDNAHNLGAASTGRIKDTFLVNSPTVTSDANDKDWLGTGFSPELLSAAKRIAAEIGSYKWLDAIQRETEGGPAARIHFGVRAQAVWEIMADEGLIDPLQEGVTPSSPYAFLCWDEVEDRPEGRFGVRPDQLTLFLIAAQEARIAALEDLLP